MHSNPASIQALPSIKPYIYGKYAPLWPRTMERFDRKSALWKLAKNFFFDRFCALPVLVVWSLRPSEALSIPIQPILSNTVKEEQFKGKEEETTSNEKQGTRYCSVTLQDVQLLFHTTIYLCKSVSR